ncbi:MAG: hypothetical protein WCS03_07075 [Bacteroidota bacterium]
MIILMSSMKKATKTITDENAEVETWRQRTEANNIPSTFNDKLAGGLKHSSKDPLTALKFNRNK